MRVRNRVRVKVRIRVRVRARDRDGVSLREMARVEEVGRVAVSETALREAAVVLIDSGVGG